VPLSILTFFCTQAVGMPGLYVMLFLHIVAYGTGYAAATAVVFNKAVPEMPGFIITTFYAITNFGMVFGQSLNLAIVEVTDRDYRLAFCVASVLELLVVVYFVFMFRNDAHFTVASTRLQLAQRGGGVVKLASQGTANPGSASVAPANIGHADESAVVL